MIDPVDVKRSYRFEQGFTFELNLFGDSRRAAPGVRRQARRRAPGPSRHLSRFDVAKGNGTGGFRAVIFDLGGVVFPSPFEAFDAYDHGNGLSHGNGARADPHEQRDRRVGRARTGRAHDRRVRDAQLEAEADSRGLRARRPRADGRRSAPGSGRGPRWLRAIERIRAHGLRTAALTNNWAATDGRQSPERLRRPHVRRRRRVGGRGLRKPDPRIYELVLRPARRPAPPTPCSSTTSASTSSRRARWA